MFSRVYLPLRLHAAHAVRQASSSASGAGVAAAAKSGGVLGSNSALLRKRIMRMVASGAMAGYCLLTLNSSSCATDASAAAVAAADSSSSDANSKAVPSKPKDDFEKMIDELAPMANELGLSGALGLCSGIALKRLGREAASVVGVLFLVMQGLSHMGYIKINYAKVAEDAKNLADADGDGQITANDAKVLWRRFLEVVGANLPSAGAFATGFSMGAYLG